jgi:hypothetical protein
MLIHASHNLFLENIFDLLTMDTENTRLITGESGIGLAVVGIVVAFLCWRRRLRIRDMASPRMQNTPGGMTHRLIVERLGQ